MSAELRMTSPPGGIDAIHDMLDELWEKAPSVDQMDRFRFATAIIELASNVIRHADSGAGVTWTLVLGASERELVASMDDTGIAAELDLDREMPEVYAESGRGIPLLRALMDDVVYERRGHLNHWLLRRTLA
jgi:serine/threonine-protein kinase RsbW